MLCEILFATSFWKTTDLGMIFDSIADIRQWSLDNPGLAIWNQPEVAHLDINAIVLDFLHGCENHVTKSGSEKYETTQMRELIIALLNGHPEQRPTVNEAIAIIGRPSQVKTLKWAVVPVIKSIGLEIEDDAETEPTENSASLMEMPLQHIYYLWKLAGGDVELEMTRVGLLLATPTIELLPRICRIEDGKETGSTGRDTAYLYSSATSILRLDELRHRLDSNGQADRDMFEWDANYFMVVDENDVDFLLQPTDTYKAGTSPENDEDDFIFVEAGDGSALNGRPTLGGSNSAVSIPGSAHNQSEPIRPVSTASAPSIRSNQSFSQSTQTPKLPLVQREKAPLYQYHRIRLFSQLLKQYPASRTEIIHHAKVDIPPVLRGAVWAAILGVSSDYQEAYARIDKVTDFGTDRQVSYRYSALIRCCTAANTMCFELPRLKLVSTILA